VFEKYKIRERKLRVRDLSLEASDHLLEDGGRLRGGFEEAPRRLCELNVRETDATHSLRQGRRCGRKLSSCAADLPICTTPQRPLQNKIKFRFSLSLILFHVETYIS